MFLQCNDAETVEPFSLNMASTCRHFIMPMGSAGSMRGCWARALHAEDLWPHSADYATTIHTRYFRTDAVA